MNLTQNAFMIALAAALIFAGAMTSRAEELRIGESRIEGTRLAGGATLWAAKYGLKDIPKKDRKRFWEAVEDIALLDVVIELCEKKRRNYDALIRREVKSCVDDATMRRVQAFYNKRRAHFTRTATPYACKNPKVMSSMQRFRTEVDKGIRKMGSACSLCFFC